jgi:hypothetical protein
LFPWLDLAYSLFFLPGVVLALFGIYWIAGPMTLALLPMALLMNFLMYRIGSLMFVKQGLRVRRNVTVSCFIHSPTAWYYNRMRGWLLVRVARAAQNLGDKVRHLLALTLALVSVAEAHAQIGALGDISFTGDSDRFYSYRERIGALWSYQSYLDYRGIAAQATHYTQAVGTKTARD